MEQVETKRVLVVEDDERLSRSMVHSLRMWAEEVRACRTVARAKEILAAWQPNLLVLDFQLPDGNALDCLRDGSLGSATPSTIAVSAFACPEETFALAELGVRAYLHKPIELDELEFALRKALAPPDLGPHVRNAVGHIGLKDVEASVRETMVEEAISRSQGNRRGAARLLTISRELLQHILRKRRDA